MLLFSVAMMSSFFTQQLQIDEGNALHDFQQTPVLLYAFPDPGDAIPGKINLALLFPDGDRKISSGSVTLAPATGAIGTRASGIALEE